MLLVVAERQGALSNAINEHLGYRPMSNGFLGLYNAVGHFSKSLQYQQVRMIETCRTVVCMMLYDGCMTSYMHLRLLSKIHA